MSVSAIPLRPDLAKVVEAVRLIGNDAGEKPSIQSAVISRLTGMHQNTMNQDNAISILITSKLQQVKLVEALVVRS
jgi:hypothetical protein